MRKTTLKAYVLSILAGFALGSLLLFVLSFLQKNGKLHDPEFTVANVGTMLALVVFLTVYIFWGMWEMNAGFNRLIGFGMTRKRFFIQEMATSYGFMLVSVAELVLLRELEKQVLKLSYYRAFIYEELFTKKAWLILLFILAVCAPVIRMLLGAVILRLNGRKGFWIIWALWMIGCIAPGYVHDILEKGPEGGIQEGIYRIAGFMMKIPQSTGIVMVVVLLFIMLAASWNMIRKKAVE